MNARERMLALGVLLVAVVAGGGFLFHMWFWAPLHERKDSIEALQKEVDKRLERVHQVEAEKPKLERWQLLSLPSDVDLARVNYEKYMSGLAQDSGFAAGSFSISPKPADSKSSPTLTGKVPIYTKLTFTLTGHTKLENLVSFLENFYRTGLLQQIKNIQIRRPLTGATPMAAMGAMGAQQPQNEVDVTLTAEALVLNGAENRPNLLPGADQRLVTLHALTSLGQGPMGIALVPWVAGPSGPQGPGNLAQPARDYSAIARKDIFYGETSTADEREPVELTQFVHLTDISQNHKRSEAWLYDRYQNVRTRLRSEAGFNKFLIRDEQQKAVVGGQVIRIDDRDLIFRVDADYYSIHVGQSLMETLKKKLTPEQRKELGLATPQDTAKRE